MVNGKLPKYWGSVLVAILAFAFVAIAQNTNILSVRPTASDSAVGEVRLHEKRANGNNYVGLKSPVSLAADSVFEMPGADGSSGDCLTTNGSKVLVFSPCTGSVSWDLLPPTDNDKGIGSRTSRVSSLVMGDTGLIEMYDGTYQRVIIKPPGSGSAFALRDSGGNDIFRVSGSGHALIKGGTLSGNFSFGADDTYTFGEYNYRPNTIFSRNFQVSDAVNTRVFLGTAIGQVDTGSAIYAKNAAGTDVFRVTYGGTTTVNNLTVSGTCTGCGGTNYWTKATNELYPNSTSDNVCIGCTSTSSAKLQVQNGNLKLYNDLAFNANAVSNIGSSGARANNVFATNLDLNGGSIVHNGTTFLNTSRHINVAGVASALTPTSGSTLDVGSSSSRWSGIYSDLFRAYKGTIEKVTVGGASGGAITVRDQSNAVTVSISESGSISGSNGTFTNSLNLTSVPAGNVTAPNGNAGMSTTITVRKGDDSGSCTLTVSGGLITATTC